jgi:hypothetical protein
LILCSESSKNLTQIVTFISSKGKQIVTGKENSNLLYGEVVLQSRSSTDPPLKKNLDFDVWIIFCHKLMLKTF